ncbi:O-antigen ligase family protein [Myxococcus sp. K15C18031901]|uniref:O-antigen ligase family protein n=1 Tax=Myxococcus dinghuensis TaxID=2906761 RepID=UPI0020A764A7|nr:O-antigen ligase family protein [Myxococcus dinghuensis]MCP3101364.1 O-antigen ligase family protein [Myxococcus dinghuensis]
MDPSSRPSLEPRLRLAVAAVLVMWAVGLVLAEVVLQVAAAAAVLLALVLAARRQLRLAPDVRAYVFASMALCAWQLVSPALALATGTASGWPRSARYGQVLDSVAGAAVASIGSVGVPWMALAGTVAAGWLFAAALGMFQSRVRWPWEPPAFLKLNLSRLHENFGTEASPRYAAGGIFFHRLRFAHGAIAALGPALAILGGSEVARRRLLAGAVVLGMLMSIYNAYARAALGAALLVSVVALLLLVHGTLRKVGLVLIALLVVVVLSSSAWRARMGKALGNIYGGERELAMSVGWSLVREHPWVGVGFGNHKSAALANQAQSGITELLATDSHNLWLTTWAETGLVGLVLLLAVHVLLGWALVRRHRAGSLAATGALLSFVGFHILALVHYLPFHTSVHLSFALMWGLGLCDGSEVLRDRPAGRPG